MAPGRRSAPTAAAPTPAPTITPAAIAEPATLGVRGWVRVGNSAPAAAITCAGDVRLEEDSGGSGIRRGRAGGASLPRRRLLRGGPGKDPRVRARRPGLPPGALERR